MSVSRLQRVLEDRKEMVSFREVCIEYLTIHPNTGYKLKREGRFPIEVVQLGNRYFVRRADLERYLHRTPTVVAL